MTSEAQLTSKTQPLVIVWITTLQFFVHVAILHKGGLRCSWWLLGQFFLYVWWCQVTPRNFFGESGCVFLKICFYGNNCFCIVVPVVPCHLGSQAVNGVGQRQSFQCPLIWIIKNKTIPKTMETHAENMACSMQKSKKTRWMNNALVRQRHVHLLSPTILLVFISEDRWWLSRCGAKHLKHSKSFPTLQTIQTTSWYADI